MSKSIFKVEDFTKTDSESDTVAIVYLGNIPGSVHIYKDGKVVISSPLGTSVTQLMGQDNKQWRKEKYIEMLISSGVDKDKLLEIEKIIDKETERLSKMDFRQAVDEIAQESNELFRRWCKEQGIDYEKMSEEDMDKLVEEKIAEVRAKGRKNS